MITPYQDQVDFSNKIIKKIQDNYIRICCQLPTGAGKTVVFSYVISRFLKKSPSVRVLILVHRQELKTQTEKTLLSFDIRGVRVEMIEKYNNELKKHPDSASRISMLVIDECHRGEFFKIVNIFKANAPSCLILGFSATPISASKNTPLKSFFQTIVTGTEINQLIKMGRLCPAIHHSIEQDIAKIGMSGGDYALNQILFQTRNENLFLFGCEIHQVPFLITLA
jgi:superfamily II DNA or RNA helicase